MAAYRYFEGARPRTVLVEDRRFAGPGEREREVAVSSLSGSAETPWICTTAWITVGRGSG
jgi:hypothetical protein